MLSTISQKFVSSKIPPLSERVFLCELKNKIKKLSDQMVTEIETFMLRDPTAEINIEVNGKDTQSIELYMPKKLSVQKFLLYRKEYSFVT